MKAALIEIVGRARSRQLDSVANITAGGPGSAGLCINAEGERHQRDNTITSLGCSITDVGQLRLWVVMNLPTFDGHLVKGILAPMEVFHEPQGIQEVYPRVQA